MRFLNLLLPLFSLLPFALADGAAIQSAMKAIIQDTTTLNSTVASYNGQILTLLKILEDSIKLQNTVKSGTETAEDSAPLSALETLGVAGDTQTLTATVQSSLDTIVAKKKTFQKFLLQPAILLTLKQQRSGSTDFGNAVVAKVPEELRGVAQNLIKPVEDAFNKAVDEYEKFP